MRCSAALTFFWLCRTFVQMLGYCPTHDAISSTKAFYKIASTLTVAAFLTSIKCPWVLNRLNGFCPVAYDSWLNVLFAPVLMGSAVASVIF
jgi:hypothetical protein